MSRGTFSGSTRAAATLQCKPTSTLSSTYSSRVLPVDAAVAAAWGRMCAAAEQDGRRLAVVDGLIAATAIHHGLTVVTRNTKDFAPTEVSLLDPWRG